MHLATYGGLPDIALSPSRCRVGAALCHWADHGRPEGAIIRCIIACGGRIRSKLPIPHRRFE